MLDSVPKGLICFLRFSDLRKATKENFSEVKRSGTHRMATSGITDNIGLMRSFWSEAEEIWEIYELSKFPHKPC